MRGRTSRLRVSMRRSTPEFFDSINAWRAIMALNVVFFHTFGVVHEALGGIPRGLELTAELRVQIFLVLSGFSLEWALIRKPKSDVTDFTVRRLIRILPPYWLATLLISFLFIRNGVTVTAWGNFWPSMLLIPHYSLHSPGFIYPLLVPGWTLFYEFFFYVVFGTAMALGGRYRLQLACGILVSMVIAGLIWHPQQAVLKIYTNWMMLEFVVGMVAARMVKRWGLPPAFCSLGIVIAASLLIAGWVSPMWSLIAVTAGCFGILATEGWKIWTWKPLSWLGSATYSIYIWHGLFIGTIFKRVGSFINHRFNVSPLSLTFIVATLAVLCTLVVYVLLDKPFFKWATKTWKKWFTARTAVSSLKAS